MKIVGLIVLVLSLSLPQAWAQAKKPAAPLKIKDLKNGAPNAVYPPTITKSNCCVGRNC
jgi:hypothetical protein